LNTLRLIQEGIHNLPDIMSHYENAIKDYKVNLELNGKTIERANKEQTGWLSYYDELRIEMKSVLNYVEIEVDKIKGKQWRKYKENFSIELSMRDLDQYTYSDPEYVEMRQVYCEVEQLYNKVNSIVECYKARAYSLKNITDLRIHSLSDVVL
jgi:hypothetical protein